MTDAHVRCLREALIRSLGEPAEGTVAYVRCLPPEVIVHLCKCETFRIDGWQIRGVGEEEIPEQRFITADRAVDLREEKQVSLLLLVDPGRAGAGMDGIYSAGREISEAELLGTAIEVARENLPRGLKGFVKEAVRRARKVGGSHALSPCQHFDFHARCVNDPEGVGRHLAGLGLWPVDTSAGPDIDDLAISAEMVERLLLTSGGDRTIRGRVDSLLLPEEAIEQRRDLEEVLRKVEGRRWSEALLEIQQHPDLMVNALQPGFSRQVLRQLDLLSWRGTRQNLLAWSGLSPDEDGNPVFLVPKENGEKGAKERKLEVRWKTTPAGLPSGSLTYEVSVIAGSSKEVLATRSVIHTGKETQRCVFSCEDFADLEEDGKWEARVRIHPIGEPEPEDGESGPLCKESEEFTLTFGDPPAGPRTSVARSTRALVEEAIRLPEEEFALVDRLRVEEDRNGDLTCRLGERSARVSRPELIREVEADWQQRDFAIGRWVVRVRADGSRAGSVAFEPFEPPLCAEELWQRLTAVSREVGQKAMARGGFVGQIHRGNDGADGYVNVWIAALEEGAPLLTLVHTVEVQTLDGRSLGLVVLPGHPLRLAWHQAYDELAYHVRYKEGVKPAEVVKALRTLDGSQMPAFLPGLAAGQSFVFGDTLGFYAVAMLAADEPEPQAALAQLARCLSSQREDVAAPIGVSTATGIGREIARYADLHPEYTFLRVHALRPGDGSTMARALAGALPPDARGPEEDSGEGRVGPVFCLQLYPACASSDSRLLGRHLSEVTERRRAGAGTIEAGQRWMTETLSVGKVLVPKLRWSKRPMPMPTEPAHLAVAFDTLASEVVALPKDEEDGASPLEVYGLVPSLRREFRFEPEPTWRVTVASQVEGERHPVAKGLTDRLVKMHQAVLRATAAHVGASREQWPALVTRIPAEKEDALRRLHELSDWVITVDRNAGIEYFDAPRQAPDRFETYVIDCVPERRDLDSLQLVTSTSNVREVLRLLERTLADMSLSYSPRNCDFLLSHLKAVSGRLAMRLASHSSNRGELIALALFHANCALHSDSSRWLSLQEGFLVPLDDVRELLFPGPAAPETTVAAGQEPATEGGSGDRSSLRSDLVYVSLSKRGLLQFTFIEVKYRRLLRSARAPELLAYAQEQTSVTRERWRTGYSLTHLSRTQLAIRRKQLARALRFYADKARRHQLTEAGYERLCVGINKLFRSDGEFTLDPAGDRGYVFCPEHGGPPVEVAQDERARILLFGPQSLPDEPAPPPLPAVASAVVCDASGRSEQYPEDWPTVVSLTPGAPNSVTSELSAADVPTGALSEAALLLGHTLHGETPVEWPVSVRSNPHLMIVGLPGMGKTTCIVNLCDQLSERGITPVLFAYHEDLEAKLAERLGALEFVDIEAGLGFNPLGVIGNGSHAWIDNVGMLRDIFASIYPDLGDLQTNEIREAIKQSYLDQGYGLNGKGADEPLPPAFQRFFDLLAQKKPRPNAGLMARLAELNDYGFFRNTEDRASLLDTRVPTIVRLHTSQNEVLQNATASFVLFSLYQRMFLRGTQPRLTHAIVFDEAHRASRLKLLPTMAKECRKFGISLIVASQEARDFSPSLYAAVANYLVLRVTEADATALAKNAVQSTEAHRLAGRLKQLDKYTAMFATEGRSPTYLSLQS